MTAALWMLAGDWACGTGCDCRELRGCDVDIRWPNDLLVNGRKCGGILVETAVTSG